jgi:hypothetical protein
MRHLILQRDSSFSPISSPTRRSAKTVRVKSKPVLPRFSNSKESPSPIRLVQNSVSPTPIIKGDKEAVHRDSIYQHYFPQQRLFKKSIIGEIKLPNNTFNLSSPRADAYTTPLAPDFPAIELPKILETTNLLKQVAKSCDGRRFSMLKKFKSSLKAVNSGLFNYYDQVDEEAAQAKEYEKPESKEFLRACKLGEITILKVLLSKHPGIENVCDYVRMTGLHWAALRGRAEVIDLLVSHGAKVNALDCVISNQSNRTPLFLASKYDNLPCIQRLLSHKANPHISTFSLKTPLKVAKSEQARKVIRLSLKVTLTQYFSRNLTKEEIFSRFLLKLSTSFLTKS